MIYVILLEPVVPGNVGAIARVMKNFDFDKLVLINPHCDHLGTEARNRAKHAQEVLENAEVVDFFVVDDYDYLVATTARLGTDYNIQRSPLTPEELGRKLKKIDPKKKIGLVIGRESHGMFNEEIAKCDFIVTIPSSKDSPTLNISHAVGLILYDLFKVFGEQKVVGHITPIGKAEKDQVLRMFNEIFDRMKWETREKKETQQTLWKRVVGKAMLTKREAYGVMGFLRKVIQVQGKKDIVMKKKGAGRKKKKSAGPKKAKAGKGKAKAKAGKSKPKKQARKKTKPGVKKSARAVKR
jgi:TrmH family RNA methyltransferase